MRQKSYRADSYRLLIMSYGADPHVATRASGIGGPPAYVTSAPSRLKRPALPRTGPAQGREGDHLMAPQESQANTDAHWEKTSRLMWIHLGLWVFFGYIVHMFVVPLNKIIIPVLNFPLGFYMAAQGSLIVFVVMLFVFAKQQDKIDREFGMAEED